MPPHIAPAPFRFGGRLLSLMALVAAAFASMTVSSTTHQRPTASTPLPTTAPIASAPPMLYPGDGTEPIKAVPMTSELEYFEPSSLLVFPALSEEENRRQSDTEDPSGPKAYQTGVVRETGKTTDSILDGASAKWSIATDGTQLATILVHSPDASGVRLRLDDVTLPLGVELVLYNPANPDEAFGPYLAADFRPSVDFWTETIFSDIALLECRVPAGISPKPVSVTIGAVAHHFADAFDSFKNAGSCNIGIMCASSTWQNIGTGVGRFTFVKGGNTYLCTGALMTTQDSSFTPYFLTAHHCLSTSSEASSIEVFWRYRASSCGGSVPSLSTLERSRGATMLAAGSRSQSTDFSFMRLSQGPPSGTWFLGWSFSSQSRGTNVHGIHHPRGDHQRYSGGSITSSSTNYLSVRWSQGTTETGSSGSPLLNASGQIVGQLFGGAASCTNLSGIDEYGRLDRTASSIRSYLEGTTAPPPSGGPTNDNFPGTTLSGNSSSTNGTTVGATRQSGEPAHLGNTSSGTVWYSWTASSSGSTTFATCNAASFDTMIAVYTGSAVGSLSLVASNDDSCGTRSSVTFSATAGTTYRVVVTGFGTASGTFTLNWSLTTSGGGGGDTGGGGNQVPSNVLFPGTALVAPNGAVNGSTVGAYRQVGEPLHLKHPSASVWYTWTAPWTERVTFSTCSSADYDTVLAVYSGDSVDRLKRVAANDDAAGCGERSRVTFKAVAGVTYRIAVAGFRQESGNFRLDWQINPCTYRVSPLARNVSPNGAFRQRISVNAPAGCQWTATSDAPWITITSGSNGSGKGRVEFNVAANTVLEPISGTLTVAGQTVTIRQAAGRARIFSVDEGAPEPARWAPLPTTKPLPTPTPTPTVAPPRP